jgi:hypothetical protein
MSESSLPLFGPTKVLLRTFRPTRLKRVLERLPFGKRHEAGSTGEEPALESRAVWVVCEYLDAHAANLERAVRLEEKAERLEEAGIPSESARNRAERARGEVMPGLAALRASFFEASGNEAAHAFDQAVKLLCPVFASRLLSDGHPR